MTIYPRKNNVILTKIDLDEKSKGGIYIPKGETSKNMAEILSVGPEVKDLKRGERVIFSEYDGKEIKSSSGTYIVIEDNKILGTFK